MAPIAAFKLRWKGTVTGPFPITRITEMLRTGEISLLHNIEVDGKWTTVRDHFRTLGLTRHSSAASGFAAPLSPFASTAPAPFGSAEEPPPLPGAPPPPPPRGRVRSPSELLERSVREGYLWCGATFLLPPIFALVIFPLSWMQNTEVRQMNPLHLATIFILAALLGSFLPLAFVRRINSTLAQAGLKEEGEAQLKLAIILGISGAILWLLMSGWYIKYR
jgi:hypothetical protein